jgi:hypothetical protein
MAREWFYTSNLANADETVASFVERHYGTEMVGRLADPLLAGIYGGDASQLSMRAVLPRFLEMEAKHGSLGRAMMTARASTASNSARPLFTHEHQAIGNLHQSVVHQDVSLALRIIGADELIGESQLPAEIRGPGFLGEERIRASFDEEIPNTLGDNHASETRARFKEQVFDGRTGAFLLFESEGGG